MGKLKEASDYIIYVHRTPDQCEANLAKFIIKDMHTGNRIVLRDVIFNMRNNVTLMVL